MRVNKRFVEMKANRANKKVQADAKHVDILKNHFCAQIKIGLPLLPHYDFFGFYMLSQCSRVILHARAVML